MSLTELPQDRLSTTDARGGRVYLYPADVQGKWRNRRTLLSIGLMAIFLVLPWIQIGGHQALLLDIAHRKFAVFGLTFWAHDTPLVFLIVGGAIITIGLITAIWGRAWCGWGCPQTVFVDQVFRRWERWIEGNALTRRRLDESPRDLNWAWKKMLKWSGFTGLAMIMSHSFLAYFVGTQALGKMMITSPSEHLSVFLAMLGMTLLVLFDFGWFREQFCTVVCPYGRFQSVLMDSQSLVVAYDAKRGEPRRGTPSPTGDCVNCFRCVQVCPTGIDIRRGVQLECVACTACMDACDEVMRRLNKPPGLIRYGNLATTEGRNDRAIPWTKRPRAWVLITLVLVFASTLAWSIQHRASIEITLIRAVDSPYQEVPGADGKLVVLNHFKANVQNQTFEDQEVEFSLPDDVKNLGAKLVISNANPKLPAGGMERADLFIQFPKSILSMGKGILNLTVGARSTPQAIPLIYSEEVHLVGPLR